MLHNSLKGFSFLGCSSFDSFGGKTSFNSEFLYSSIIFLFGAFGSYIKRKVTNERNKGDLLFVTISIESIFCIISFFPISNPIPDAITFDLHITSSYSKFIYSIEHFNTISQFLLLLSLASLFFISSVIVAIYSLFIVIFIVFAFISTSLSLLIEILKEEFDKMIMPFVSSLISILNENSMKSFSL